MGVTLAQVEAMPICGFLKSASVKPTARSMARAGAASMPSTTREEYLRMLSVMSVISKPLVWLMASSQTGLMFWFIRKRFVGSYFFLGATSRLYVAP